MNVLKLKMSPRQVGVHSLSYHTCIVQRRAIFDLFQGLLQSRHAPEVVWMVAGIARNTGLVLGVGGSSKTPRGYIIENSVQKLFIRACVLPNEVFSTAHTDGVLF